MANNPLQKYFRQPKISVSLPSKGLFYERGVLAGDYNNVPIFAMTGMDEIIFKTPDALFNGEAVTKVVESCCPYISDAKKVPSLDIDTLMIAIRIATFGPKMTIEQTCKNCGEENQYEINLSNLLDYFKDLTFITQVQVNSELSLKIRPLSYEEMTAVATENFKLQKMLYQTIELPDDQKQTQMDQIYAQLAELQLELYLMTIEAVQIPGEQVTDKNMIREWLQNADREVYQQIKDKLESNKEVWSIPKQHVNCASCGTADDIQITMDQSNFFV